MPLIDIPDVGRVEFPDTMTDSEIVSAIKSDILGTQITRRPDTGGAAGAPTLPVPNQPNASLLFPGPSGVALGQVPIQAQQVQERAATPQEQALTQKLETPLVTLPKEAFVPPVTALVAPQVASGLAEFGKEQAEGMTSPAGLAATPYMALGLGEGWALKSAGMAGRAIAMGFGLEGGAGLTQTAPEFVDAVKRGDVEAASKAAAATALNSLMVAGGVGAVLRPQGKPPIIPKDPVASAKQILPRAAATLEKEGVTDASKVETPAEVHGDVRSQPGQSAGQVPVAESGAGVQPQAEGGLPEKTTLTPAIKVADKTFLGTDHIDAYENAKASGQPDTSGAQEGFVDSKGNFLTREEAASKSELPTNVEPGKLHSSDLKQADPLPQYDSSKLEAAKEGATPEEKEARFQAYLKLGDDYEKALKEWEQRQPQNKPIILKQRAGNYVAITKDPSGKWRATYFGQIFRDDPRLAPNAHDVYNTRAEAVRAHAIDATAVDKLPGEILTEPEIKAKREQAIAAAGQAKPAPEGAAPKPKPSAVVEQPYTIIDAIKEIGAIRSKKAAKPGSEGYYTPEFSALERKGESRKLFSPTGQGPDEMLDTLRRQGLLSEHATVDDLAEAISKANAHLDAYKKGELSEQKAAAFEEAMAKQAKRAATAKKNSQNLRVGDRFRMGGKEFKVTDVNPDTGEVTVEGDKRIGRQTIPDNAEVPIEKGSYRKVRRSTEFVPEDEGFALDKPESVEEQKARLAEEQKKAQAKADQEKLAAGAEKPLIGSRGDIGQGDLLGGGDLFSNPPSNNLLGIVSSSAAKGVEVGEAIGKQLFHVREGFKQLWESEPNRREMTATYDGAETLANGEGRQVYNELRLHGSLLDRQAAFAIIEADSTYAKLGQFLTQVRGRNLMAEKAVRHAMLNYARLQPLAERVKAILDAQIEMEKQAGIDTEYRENYVPHVLDMDLLMGTKRPVMLAGAGSGLSTAFKKGRTFDTIFDAIENGYTPKSLDVAKLAEHRVRAGQEMINRVMWAEALKSAIDPIDKKPIVTDLRRHSRGPGKPGWEDAPVGYVPLDVLPGVRVAVHEGYARYWKALNGQSTIAESIPGHLLLEVEGGIKHGLLLFDTFHASRILQKELFLTRSLGGMKEMVSDTIKGLTGGRVDPQWVSEGAGYKKGFSLLEYSDLTLAKALASGEITPEIARWVQTNRPKADLLMKSGLNVGRIQEALYSSIARKMPVIGEFNKWTFEKMTRGAMLESGLIEFDRIKAANPSMSDKQVAGYVSRRLNQLYGNLGRQGLFKSATSRDLARLAFLAPQWVESMVRTELGGARELLIDPIAKRQSIIAGTLARSVGQGLAAYFVGTQLLNIATRGQPTWMNPEEGHKMDAWIPDVTGRTNGFFISPLAVVAEISHDIVRYLHSEGSLMRAAARIASNKFSPFLRAGQVLYSGETPTRERIPDDWTRLVYAGFALAPTPIPLSPIVKSDYPGQIQRQLTASMGFKTEPAASNVQRISRLAKEFAKEQGHDTPIEIMHVIGTGYGDLRAALRRGDDETAKKELEKLRGSKKDSEILHAFDLYVSRPFTGSLKMETKFKASLTPEQREAYENAKDEKRTQLANLKRLMREE